MNQLTINRFLSALTFTIPDVCVLAVTIVSRAVQGCNNMGLHGYIMRVMALDKELKLRKDANVYVKVCQGHCFSQDSAIGLFWCILCVGELGGQIWLQYSPRLHLQTEGCTISNRVVKAKHPTHLADKTLVAVEIITLYLVHTGRI